MSTSRQARRRGRRGYILVMTSFSLLFLLGVAGLAIDIGRMYITKNEAQAYVDSAAINSALKLDGTSAGITAASSTSSDTDKWRFDTQPFTSVTTTFSDSANGTYTASPANPATSTYVKVTASASLPMYLIRPLTGPTATISATAVAYGKAITTLPSGVFPFSPYTRTGAPDDANDPFGYKIGNDYTLRWSANGTKNPCGTDSMLNPGDAGSIVSKGSIRGYCCVSNSAADLRQAIEGGQTDSVTIGQSLQMENGGKTTEMSAIDYRVSMDTDTTSTTYADYKASGTGNGARVVVVAVNSGDPNYTALGFAAFFLDNNPAYSGLKGDDSACGQYIGAWTQGSTPPVSGWGAGNTAGGYRVRLAQ